MKGTRRAIFSQTSSALTIQFAVQGRPGAPDTDTFYAPARRRGIKKPKVIPRRIEPLQVRPSPCAISALNTKGNAYAWDSCSLCRVRDVNASINDFMIFINDIAPALNNARQIFWLLVESSRPLGRVSHRRETREVLSLFIQFFFDAKESSGPSRRETINHLGADSA